jgi:hypothetical protein
MRHDMGKCVIEAPRRGSSAKGNKVRTYGKVTLDSEGYDYEGATKIPSSMRDKYARNDKDFSDKLGPLHRYLLSNCGRLWDDVYSEISYNIGRFTKSEGLRHIIDAHMPVEINTYRAVNGGVYYYASYGGPTRVDETSYWHRPEFYVEPETGILRASRKKANDRKPASVEAITLSASEEYRKIDGIWYYQRFDRKEEKVYRYTYSNGTHHYEWVTTVTVVEKKQLNKKELRELAKLL